MIKVSIVIPAYNEICFIRDTLNSVVNEADEIIIGDNASTDGTSEVIAEFAKKHKHVKHIKHKKNMGSCKNFEFIVKESKGYYVRFVGAHDIISKGSTNSMLEIFEKNEDASSVYSKTSVIVDENNIYRGLTRHNPLGYEGSALQRILYLIMFRDYSTIYGMYRRDFLLQIPALKIMEFATTDLHWTAKLLISGKAYWDGNSHYLFRMLLNNKQDTTTRYNKAFGGGLFSWTFATICGIYEQVSINFSRKISDSILEILIKKYALSNKNFVENLEFEIQNYELCKIVESKKEFAEMILDKIKDRQNKPQNIIKSITEIYIENTNKEHIIFGAGKNGQHLIAEFSLSNIQVSYFCDNNPSLHGKTILGAKCISFEELKQYKDSAVIYVSTAKAAKIYEQLKENNFKYVFPKELMEFVSTL